MKISNLLQLLGVERNYHTIQTWVQKKTNIMLSITQLFVTSGLHRETPFFVKKLAIHSPLLISPMSSLVECTVSEHSRDFVNGVNASNMTEQSFDAKQ